MEIPYTVTPRPDTGLANPKLGIWLFLASEVMLFGGLFSGYLFLRIGAEPGYWPHGLLNVPVGAMNTAILIASSVTVVLAWASLKMRNLSAYKLWMGISILCGAIFLIVKLAYEWPQKFEHFGAFIKKDALAKYEPLLGNDHVREKNAKEGTAIEPRVEISGHLHEVEVEVTPEGKEKFEAFVKAHELEVKPDEHHANLLVVEGKHLTPAVAEQLEHVPGVKVEAFQLGLDPINAAPTSSESDKPHFLYKGPTETLGKIEREDVDFFSAFAPKHSTYFAIYFTITGLHGLHVLAGVLVMFYFWLPIEGGTKMFRKNPEQLANRVEVVGLFWHFVDLVWIFVFPIFYLL
jgi:cytochrome c oxidase subunit 3